jgi:hypothetical protein
MMNRAIFTTLAVVCAALPALAANLEFSGNGVRPRTTSSATSHEDDDVLFRLRPGVRIYEDHGDDLNFSAGYSAPIEFSLDNSSELNDVDHIGSGLFNYHANDRIQIFGHESFGYLRSTLRNQPVDTSALELAQGTPGFNDQRDRVTTNTADIGALYNFSPRTVARATLSSTFFDSTRQDRAQVYSIAGFSDLIYKLSIKRAWSRRGLHLPGLRRSPEHPGQPDAHLSSVGQLALADHGHALVRGQRRPGVPRHAPGQREPGAGRDGRAVHGPAGGGRHRPRVLRQVRRAPIRRDRRGKPAGLQLPDARRQS